MVLIKMSVAAMPACTALAATTGIFGRGVSELGLVEQHRRAAAAVGAQRADRGNSLIGGKVARADRDGTDSARGDERLDACHRDAGGLGDLAN